MKPLLPKFITLIVGISLVSPGFGQNYPPEPPAPQQLDAMGGSFMDAIQTQRAFALNNGYLRSNGQIRVVTTPGDIEILPADPAVVYVPYYDPYVVYSRPRPGFAAGGTISFGPRVVVQSFAP